MKTPFYAVFGTASTGPHPIFCFFFKEIPKREERLKEWVYYYSIADGSGGEVNSDVSKKGSSCIMRRHRVLIPPKPPSAE